VRPRRRPPLLGLAAIAWLGYADSGMSGWEQNDAEGSFHRADLDEAARRLADVLDEEDADVLVGYDWHGGYGHPDHVKVHHLVHAAAPLARRTPRLLESTFNRTDMSRDGRRGAGRRCVVSKDSRTGTPTTRWTTGTRWQHRGRDHLGGRRLGVPGHKRAALEAHRSQASDIEPVPGHDRRDLRPVLRPGALHRARSRRPDAPRLAVTEVEGSLAPLET
jgi:LmbE family N-acetylglucosaminyl deacetylase